MPPGVRVVEGDRPATVVAVQSTVALALTVRRAAAGPPPGTRHGRPLADRALAEIDACQKPGGPGPAREWTAVGRRGRSRTCHRSATRTPTVARRGSERRWISASWCFIIAVSRPRGGDSSG